MMLVVKGTMKGITMLVVKGATTLVVKGNHDLTKGGNGSVYKVREREIFYFFIFFSFIFFNIVSIYFIYQPHFPSLLSPLHTFLLCLH